MAVRGNFLVKNIANTPCATCGTIHEFISRGSKHAQCGTPVAFDWDHAHHAAVASGNPPEAVESMRSRDDDVGDTLVILDDSARKLPQRAGNIQVLATNIDQFVPVG